MTGPGAATPVPTASLWSQQLGTAALGPAAIAADGTIYVGSSTGVYARTSAGAAKWTNPTTPGIGAGAGPTIGADGTVYYVTTGTSSVVRALTPGTTSPTQKWVSATAALNGASSCSPVLSADGATVYATSKTGKLVALRVFPESGGAAGSMRWIPTFTTTGSSPISGSVAIGIDGTLYVGADNGLYAVNPTNGVQISSKSYTTGTPIVRTTPAIGPDGTVYFGTDNLGLVAVKDGVFKWKYPASGTPPVIRSSPAVAGDGTIYFGTRTVATSAAQLVALNPNGTLKWSYPAAGNVDATPAIGADGMVYVTADDKKFYALRQNGTTTTAEVRMNIALGTGASSYARSAISIARNGVVLAPAEDGKLSAFGPGSCSTSDTSCDGTDNNCNGSIDEGYVAQATSCGVGACARTGTSSCVNGAVQANCAPGTPAASDTTCNNVDDNCNGTKDEGYVPVANSCGVGACQRTANSTCVNGAVQNNCTPGTPAANDVTCDNVDDNCNGSKDEGYVSTATSCGVGVCARSGVTSCSGGAVINSCVAGTPTASIDTTCNNLDENCNGTNDEGFVASVTSCGVGACVRTGASSCVNGAVLSNCTPGVPATDDTICNNLDDDCDGSKDEDFVATQISCGVGACVNTTNTSCVAGSVQNLCSARPKPSPSDLTCDGIDDNCSGVVDEGCVTATSPGPNLLLNGSFDVDLTNVGTLKTPNTGAPAQTAPEMLTRDTADTANGSAGAAHIRIVKTPGFYYATHNAGVILNTSELIPAETTLQFTFWAKSISGGKILSFTRVWGDYPTRVRIDSSWNLYQIYVRTGQVSNSFLVNLSPTDDDELRTMDDGEFLIDEVTLRKVPDAPRRCGATFDQACSPSCTAPACAPAGMDAVSRPATALLSMESRLRAAYTDAGIRVRRAANNAEQNIGYTSDHKLDFAALSAFCGDSDCYLSVLYDQSGNNRDLKQVRYSLQPKVYNGTTHQLSSGRDAPNLPSDQGVPYLRSTGGTGIVGNPGHTIAIAARYLSASSAPRAGLTARLTPGGDYQFITGANGAGFYFGDGGMSWPIPSNDGLKRFVFQQPAAGNHGTSKLWLNGVDLGASPQISGTVASATSFSTPYLFLYTHPATSVTTFAAWDAMLGDADRAAADSALGQSQSSVVFDPGGSVQLGAPLRVSAQVDTSTGAQVVGEPVANSPIAFQIPERLRVTVGNAGNGTTLLTYKDGNGNAVTCTYVGGSPVASPVRDLDRALGRYYRLLSCSNSALAGATVVGSNVGITVNSGDPQIGVTQVEANIGSGCDVLEPSMWPEDVVQMRESFDWTKTSALPTTDPTGLPALRYALMYLESDEQAAALEQTGVYFRTRPLFTKELSRYLGKCGVFDSTSDNRGLFVYALIPAAAYNSVRAAAMASFNAGAGPVPFRAIVLPPVPEPSFANSDGTVSWQALHDAGFRYSDQPSEAQAPFLGIHIPIIDDVIDAIKDGDPLKAVAGVLLPGAGGKLVDVGHGATPTQLFVSEQPVPQLINDVNNSVALILNTWNDLFGGDEAPNGEVTLRLNLSVMNPDPTFWNGAEPEITRAWGPRALDIDHKKVVPHGAKMHVLQAPVGSIVVDRWAELGVDGHFTIRVPRRDGYTNGALCMRLENAAARVGANVHADDFCDFGALDAVFDHFHHDVPLSSTADPQKVQAHSPELLALTEITDGWDYMTQVAQHTPRQAAVATTGLSSLISSANGGRAVTPCLTVPGPKTATDFLDSFLGPLFSGGVGAVLGATGLFAPTMAHKDMFLPRSALWWLSRGTASHEYGHFVMCDLLSAKNSTMLAEMYLDYLTTLTGNATNNTPNPPKLNRTSDVPVLMESFADFFAAQVVSGVNYALRGEGDVTSSHEMRYCDAWFAGSAPATTCLENNFHGNNESKALADATSEASYFDEINRRLTTYYDAFDRATDDARTSFVPTNADAWRVVPQCIPEHVPPASPLSCVTRADAPQGYMLSADENVQLGGPDIVNWMNHFATDCGDNCAASNVDSARALANTMKDRGVSWCDICRLFALHDPLVFYGDTVMQVWQACTKGELKDIVGPPPEPGLRLEIDTCQPCALGETANSDGHCVSCAAANGSIDPTTGVCTFCPAGYVAVGGQCQVCPSHSISQGNVCVACPLGQVRSPLGNFCSDCSPDAVVNLAADACGDFVPNVAQTAQGPGDLCPEVFVLQVDNAGVLASSSTSNPTLRIGAINIDPGSSSDCSSLFASFRGAITLTQARVSVAGLPISLDAQASVCTLNCNGKPCAFPPLATLVNIPGSSFTGGVDGARLILDPGALAGRYTDLAVEGVCPGGGLQ